MAEQPVTEPGTSELRLPCRDVEEDYIQFEVDVFSTITIREDDFHSTVALDIADLVTIRDWLDCQVSERGKTSLRLALADLVEKATAITDSFRALDQPLGQSVRWTADPVAMKAMMISLMNARQALVPAASGAAGNDDDDGQ